MPGIIADYGNFSLYDNHLYFYLDQLAPTEQQIIQFEFYIPNSGTINSIYLTYNNTEKIENLDSYKITTLTNEIFYTAKIDYKNALPFVNTLKFEYVDLVFRHTPDETVIFPEHYFEFISSSTRKRAIVLTPNTSEPMLFLEGKIFWRLYADEMSCKADELILKQIEDIR